MTNLICLRGGGGDWRGGKGGLLALVESFLAVLPLARLDLRSFVAVSQK